MRLSATIWTQRRKAAKVNQHRIVVELVFIPVVLCAHPHPSPSPSLTPAPLPSGEGRLESARGGRSRFQAHCAWMRPRSGMQRRTCPRAYVRLHGRIPGNRGPCSTFRRTFPCTGEGHGMGAGRGVARERPRRAEQVPSALCLDATPERDAAPHLPACLRAPSRSHPRKPEPLLNVSAHLLPARGKGMGWGIATLRRDFCTWRYQSDPQASSQRLPLP